MLPLSPLSLQFLLRIRAATQPQDAVEPTLTTLIISAEIIQFSKTGREMSGITLAA